MHLRRSQSALALDDDLGVAGDRHDVPFSVRPHPQPLLPPYLHRRRLGRAAAKPARPHGEQRARIAGRARAVIDAAGLHLRVANGERDRLVAVEQDAAGGDLVAEACGPCLELGAVAGHDHRTALRLDLDGLEPPLAPFPAAGLGLTAGEHDREQVAGEVIGGRYGGGADDIDVILERDHVGRDVEAEAPTAAHEYGRRRLVGRRGRRRCRGFGVAARQETAGQAFEPHPHIAIEADRVHAADVGPLIGHGTAGLPRLHGRSLPRRPFAGHEFRQHAAAAAARPAVAELHHLIGLHLQLVELDIAGDDLDVVVGVRRRRRSPDRDLAAEAAADELGKPALPKIERLVELEHRPLRRPEHDRTASRLLGRHAVPVGQHDERAGHEVHAAVGEGMVVLEQQPHLPALEHDGVVTLP